MAAPSYSVEESIEILKRAKIKTIVIEGVTDLELLRNLETKLRGVAGEVDFFIAGSKAAVLKIWSKREHFRTASIGFLADSDMWLFDVKTREYPGVVFTDGYSIENISIQNDCFPNLIAHNEELNIFWTNALLSLSQWFAAEAAFYLEGGAPILDLDVNKILNIHGGFTLSAEASARIGSCPKGNWDELLEKIQKEPLKYVRGKQLFNALHRIMEKHDKPYFNLRALKTMGVRLNNSHVDNLLNSLGEAIGSSSNETPVLN